jgi:hypothetical protein
VENTAALKGHSFYPEIGVFVHMQFEREENIEVGLRVWPGLQDLRLMNTTRTLHFLYEATVWLCR